MAKARSTWQTSRTRRVSSEDAQSVEDRSLAGQLAGDPIASAALPALRTASVLHLQRAIGNRAVGQILAARGETAQKSDRQSDRSAAAPVQRMIELGDKLYYSTEAIKLQLPGKKDKDAELGEWRANAGGLSGMDLTNVQNAYAIPGMNVATATEGNALNGKVDSGATIYQYASLSQMNGFLRLLQQGIPESTTLMPRPKDMLDEERDLTLKYDQGKACVLQALINLGIKNPELGSEQQDDPKAWHTHYVKNNIMYDDDTVIYKIYTGFGLQMVLNSRTPWRNLSQKTFTPGEYIFTTPGHNFAVLVHDSENPAERYEPKDKPQNIVTSYEPDRTISYAWRYS